MGIEALDTLGFSICPHLLAMSSSALLTRRETRFGFGFSLLFRHR